MLDISLLLVVMVLPDSSLALILLTHSDYYLANILACWQLISCGYIGHGSLFLTIVMYKLPVS